MNETGSGSGSEWQSWRTIGEPESSMRVLSGVLMANDRNRKIVVEGLSLDRIPQLVDDTQLDSLFTLIRSHSQDSNDFKDSLLNRLDSHFELIYLNNSNFNSNFDLSHFSLALQLISLFHLSRSLNTHHAFFLISLLLPRLTIHLQSLYRLFFASFLLDLDRPQDASTQLNLAAALSLSPLPLLDQYAHLLHARLHFHRLQFDLAYNSFSTLSSINPSCPFVLHMRILSALLSSPQLSFHRLQQINPQSSLPQLHPLLAYLTSWTLNPTHFDSADVWDKLVQVVPPSFRLDARLENRFNELKLYLYSQLYQSLSYPELALILDHNPSDDHHQNSHLVHSRCLEFVDELISQRKLYAHLNRLSADAPVIFDNPPLDPIGHLISLPPLQPTHQHDHKREQDEPSSRSQKRRMLSHSNHHSALTHNKINLAQDQPDLDHSDSSEAEFPLSRLPRSSHRIPILIVDDQPDLITCSATAEEGQRAFQAYKAFRSKAQSGRPRQARYKPTKDKYLRRVQRYLKFYQTLGSGAMSGWPITCQKVEKWAIEDLGCCSVAALKVYLRTLEGARWVCEEVEEVFEGKYLEWREKTRLQECERLVRLVERWPVSSGGGGGGGGSGSGGGRRTKMKRVVEDDNSNINDRVLRSAKKRQVIVVEGDDEQVVGRSDAHMVWQDGEMDVDESHEEDGDWVVEVSEDGSCEGVGKRDKSRTDRGLCPRSDQVDEDVMVASELCSPSGQVTNECEDQSGLTPDPSGTSNQDDFEMTETYVGSKEESRVFEDDDEEWRRLNGKLVSSPLLSPGFLPISNGAGEGLDHESTLGTGGVRLWSWGGEVVEGEEEEEEEEVVVVVGDGDGGIGSGDHSGGGSGNYGKQGRVVGGYKDVENEEDEDEDEDYDEGDEEDEQVEEEEEEGEAREKSREQEGTDDHHKVFLSELNKFVKCLNKFI